MKAYCVTFDTNLFEATKLFVRVATSLNATRKTLLSLKGMKMLIN
jgi:hypothetical protein